MDNQEGVNLLLILFIGTSALLIMALVIIFFVVIQQRRAIAHQLEIKEKDEKMQREMLRATIQSQEEEQRRIARDLHDELGPMLSAVKLKISSIKKVLDANNLNTSSLDESKVMLDGTITQVRNISHQLLPPILDDYGLAHAVENVCKKMNSEKLSVNFEMPGNYLRINRDAELAIYRVTLELLNNVIRHSGATAVSVGLNQQDNNLVLAVQDNGKGFDVEKTRLNGGLGLKNVQSRLKAIDGNINFVSSSAGTVATIIYNSSLE